MSGGCRNSHSPLVYKSENISFQAPSPFIYLYIYFACLSVCLFVCIQKTSKRLHRAGPNFLWDLAWHKVLFMDDRIFKNLPLTKFDFWKFCPVTPAIFSYHFVLKLISNPILFNRKCITFCSIHFCLIMIVFFYLDKLKCIYVAKIWIFLSYFTVLRRENDAIFRIWIFELRFMSTGSLSLRLCKNISMNLKFLSNIFMIFFLIGVDKNV